MLLPPSMDPENHYPPGRKPCQRGRLPAPARDERRMDLSVLSDPIEWTERKNSISQVYAPEGMESRYVENIGQMI